MHDIKTVSIIGMGALGMLFGRQIFEFMDDEHFCFLTDEKRRERHLQNGCTVNGKHITFPVATVNDIPFTPDLILIATKGDGLIAARSLAESVKGDHTLVLSLLNGITSEQVLRETLGENAVIDCIAIGMDAVRENNALTYSNMGKLQIGVTGNEQEESLRAVSDFFQKTNVPFEVISDIRKAMWNKFMINVGINQTCMVYHTTYGGATKEGTDAFQDMVAAMKEVIAVANAEGILLTEEDLENDLKILRSLNPDGLPSMQQDALAGRKSEVNLFAGTLIQIAKKHNIPVPVNERYMETILEIEKDFWRQF